MPLSNTSGRAIVWLPAATVTEAMPGPLASERVPPLPWVKVNDPPDVLLKIIALTVGLTPSRVTVAAEPPVELPKVAVSPAKPEMPGAPAAGPPACVSIQLPAGPHAPLPARFHWAFPEKTWAA